VRKFLQFLKENVIYLELALVILAFFIFIRITSGDWSVAVKFIVLFPLLAIGTFAVLYFGFIAIVLIYGTIFSIFDSRYRW